MGIRTFAAATGRIRQWRRGFRSGAAPAGVTLLEIVMVLVIIGLVAAFGLPRLDYSRFRADAGARVVRGTLQQAQRNAIQRQHDIIVSFDLTSMRIRSVEDLNNNRQADAGERAVWRRLEEGARFAAPPSTLSGGQGTAAVTGPNLRTVDGMPSIVFHANGSASTDAEIYLTTARTAASDFRAIQVTQSTGRVEWYRHNSAGWRRDGV